MMTHDISILSALSTKSTETEAMPGRIIHSPL